MFGEEGGGEEGCASAIAGAKKGKKYKESTRRNSSST